MDAESVDLKQWIESVEEYQPALWDRLPELELYMDQVLTFMNRQLEPFSPDGERMLTPSMINNYVKDGVLPRPERKKYSRDHLGMLLMICSLKTVLSLPEIAEILGVLTDDDISSRYNEFAKIHGEAMKEVSSRITESEKMDKQTMCLLAMQLALEANARRIAAARILNSFDKPKDEKEKDKQKKD